jgi:hypothetical protein
VFQV